MRKLILSILVVLAIATTATVSLGCKSDNTSSGNTELQGTWVATAPDDNTSTVTWTFDDNQWTMIFASTTMSLSMQMSGTFTLDATANPKTIDMVFASFPMEPDWVGKTSLGIYQFSGNNLKLDLGDPGDARPTAFSEEALNLIKQ